MCCASAAHAKTGMYLSTLGRLCNHSIPCNLGANHMDSVQRNTRHNSGESPQLQMSLSCLIVQPRAPDCMYCTVHVCFGSSWLFQVLLSMVDSSKLSERVLNSIHTDRLFESLRRIYGLTGALASHVTKSRSESNAKCCLTFCSI